MVVYFDKRKGILKAGRFFTSKKLLIFLEGSCCMGCVIIVSELHPLAVTVCNSVYCKSRGFSDYLYNISYDFVISKEHCCALGH
jgi:hypothetical protein